MGLAFAAVIANLERAKEIEPSHAALGTHVNLLKLLSPIAHNSNDVTNPG